MRLNSPTVPLGSLVFLKLPPCSCKGSIGFFMVPKCSLEFLTIP